MESNKRIMLSIIGIAILVIGLVGITYAFFNYTRTGSANTISVGRISFRTNQTETINLTNLFPIDPTETGIMDDETKVGTLEIEIEGDTDYSDGVEYLITTTNSSVHTSTGKIVPISLDVTVTDLGTSSDSYFTARNSKNATIYKRLSGNSVIGNQQLLVGYIKPNTTPGTVEGIDGTITIKAYLDKNKIAISDTYGEKESDNMGTTNSWVDDRVVITTEEWNNLQDNGISFQVKVEANEGIWVEETLYNLIKRNAVMDNISSTYVTNTFGIDFSKQSGDTNNDGIIDNGKGVYIYSETANDDYPIMYYRGDVNDNNVVFANRCWKIVRTTETGGVKLFYNGDYSEKFETIPIELSNYLDIINNSSNPLSFNSTDKSWDVTVKNNNGTELSFKVPEGDNYILVLTGTSSSTYGGTISFYKNDTIVKKYKHAYMKPLDLIYDFGTLTNNDVIRVVFTGNASETYQINMRIKMTKKGDSLGYNCNNLISDTMISINNETSFYYSEHDNSLAYNGYMYGDVYTVESEEYVSNYYYGNSFSYSNGRYKLTDPIVGLNASHHYSCRQTTADGTCENIVYYYYTLRTNNIRYLYYIQLSGGKSVEEAIEDMNNNTNDSSAKTYIDSWFLNNLNSYINKIEDTIWCNDRSISNLAGLNPNNGSFSGNVYYSSQERLVNLYTPSIKCDNKHDAFTVNNHKGNQNLTYPVGLLTADELVLAGLIYNNSLSTEYDDVYILNSNGIMTMTPGLFSRMSTFIASTGEQGWNQSCIVSSRKSINPVISLKKDSQILSGSGTASDPYIIK